MPIQIGGEAHKILFCRTLLDTLNPYRPANMPIWKKFVFQVRGVAVWAFLVLERLGLASSSIGAEPVQDNNFTVTGAKSVGMDTCIAGLLDICLAENDRRPGPYDGRLLRPRFVPFMVRMARRFMRDRGSAAAPA